MAYISKRNRRKEKDRQTAAHNRGELIAAGFKRRDLLKMGLLTSAGLLIPKKGLSAHPISSAGMVFDDPQSPPTTPFVEICRDCRCWRQSRHLHLHQHQHHRQAKDAQSHTRRSRSFHPSGITT
jgi:hypothetical protein